MQRTDPAWRTAITTFGTFENYYTRPEFTELLPKAEVIRRNYVAQWDRFANNVHLMIQITILYMIRRKLEQINRNAFGNIKPIRTLGTIAKQKVTFPPQVVPGKYNTQLHRQRQAEAETMSEPGTSQQPGKRQKKGPGPKEEQIRQPSTKGRDSPSERPKFPKDKGGL